MEVDIPNNDHATVMFIAFMAICIVAFFTVLVIDGAQQRRHREWMRQRSMRFERTQRLPRKQFALPSRSPQIALPSRPRNKGVRKHSSKTGVYSRGKTREADQLESWYHAIRRTKAWDESDVVKEGSNSAQGNGNDFGGRATL